jgi:predicted alpha/beta hydrolase
MEAVSIPCRDGVTLSGHLWPRAGRAAVGTVIVNPATGVGARYYHYYAAFLAEHGFDVLTYDYRGIGLSRPATLRGCGYRWRDWGELDFDAALHFAKTRASGHPLSVVGHSFGGFLPGLSERGSEIHRMLTVGAQYAYWRDYQRSRRGLLFLKWHVLMPAITALCGYFPGKRLGWLEDLPTGVANEWSFQRARMEMGRPPDTRANVLRRFARVTAPILAIGLSDDELGTAAAIGRALAYYRGASSTQILLTPDDLGYDAIGHFGLFHNRHAAGFWLDTVLWLRDGMNPWPSKTVSLPRDDYGGL